ncbi:MAG: GNAT family N-acetyltransferase [Acidobacteriota bacterium]|nr:GNAT family N-acetyltransferase [Acidobacteriota bacterium]
MKILETERLILREVEAGDGEFMLDLLNQPSFIENIGDRNVRSVAAVREYIESRFVESYRINGFGMWAVEFKETGAVLGICGFVKRDTLPDTDIGFAFLPQFEGRGFASEAAVGVMKYGAETLKFERVLAITSPGNDRSGRLLEKLGFKYERLIGINDEQLKLFAWDAE